MKTILAVFLCGAAAVSAAPGKQPKFLSMMATAHSVEGTTAAGTQSRPGTAAADPAVLPLGSRIRVHGKRGSLGEYLVTDKGSGVKGRHIDIYMPTGREVKEFGKRRVRVEVLEWGDGRADARAEDRQDRVEGRADQPRADMVK